MSQDEDDLKMPQPIFEVTGNVALADAREKQRPSPWTKTMFQVNSVSSRD